MRRLVFFVLLALFAPQAACHRAPHPRIHVVVSVFPVYDLVRRIAGPDADVTLLVPAGTPRPEAWTPPADVAAQAEKANVFVSVGLGLDTWMDAIAAKGPPKARTLRLGDRVPTLTADDGTIEANIWMDPQRARLLATAIAEELARADSSHAIVFGQRASEVDESIAELDKEVEAKVAALPRRSLIQLPASFAYFADRYGLHALKPGEFHGSLPFGFDPFGGTGDEWSYEQIVRQDTAGLARFPP